MSTRWTEYLPLVLLGAVGMGTVLALRPSPPVVVRATPLPTPPDAGEADRLGAAVQLAEVAARHDLAQRQAEQARLEAQYQAYREQIWANVTAYETQVRAQTEMEIARQRAQAEAERARLEAETRRQELELERRRIEAEERIARESAQTSFWGNFWGGLFGLVGTIAGALIGFSDEKLYQERLPWPPYVGRSRDFRLIAQRYYGGSP